MTDCVRTYSVDFGLDQIAGIAARHGLKVMQGLWLSSHADKNRYQIETAVALAKRYPGMIRAVVVGNEVLLRGEMSADDLAADDSRGEGARAGAGDLCRRLGILAAQSATSPTPSISSPFISCPIGRTSRSRRAMPPRMSMPSAGRSSAAFPGKEILIGEVGWPSAGRMREGALPSPVNQARVIQDVLALAASAKISASTSSRLSTSRGSARSKARSAAIGACSTTARARFEIQLGRSRSPIIRSGYGRRSAGSSLPVDRIRRRGSAWRDEAPATLQWLAVSANAIAGGALIGWTIENMPLESLGVGGWLRSLALAAVALLARRSVERGDRRASVPIPQFRAMLGPAQSARAIRWRSRCRRAC